MLIIKHIFENEIDVYFQCYCNYDKLIKVSSFASRRVMADYIVRTNLLFIGIKE